MIYMGRSVSPGVAIGKVYIHKPFAPTVLESHFEKRETETKLARYYKVREIAAAELEKIRDRVTTLDKEKAKIFKAHLDILLDEDINHQIISAISENLIEPDYVIEEVYTRTAEKLARVKDNLIRERAADINDIRLRLLRIYAGAEEKNLSAFEEPVIVAANDLTPSETATMDITHVMGIVAQTGGYTSHSAIIARSYGIPAILGISGLMENVCDGEEAVLDACNGKLITEPNDEQKKLYIEKREDFLVEVRDTQRFLYKPVRTSDGVKIEIGLNIGSADEHELEGAAYTDFVGLFRTEFLYMSRSSLPDEDSQFEVYRKVLKRYCGRPVVLRTLDIGGDKTLSYMELPKEENPFLGCRALRLSFQFEGMFRVQLRAALRASVYGNLWIMLPMVTGLDDVYRAKSIIQSVKQQLSTEGVPYSDDVKIGVMVEVPACAIIAQDLAKEVDFASIGTNDLCQYLTAADRLNHAISEYYQSYHPAMFRLMGYVANEFNKVGKPISVCGEMGGDCLAAPALVGLGMRKLSMGGAAVAKIKKTIAELDTAEMKKIADKVLCCSTAGEVEQYLRERLDTI